MKPYVHRGLNISYKSVCVLFRTTFYTTGCPCFVIREVCHLVITRTLKPKAIRGDKRNCVSIGPVNEGSGRFRSSESIEPLRDIRRGAGLYSILQNDSKEISIKYSSDLGYIHSVQSINVISEK